MLNNLRRPENALSLLIGVALALSLVLVNMYLWRIALAIINIWQVLHADAFMTRPPGEMLANLLLGGVGEILIMCVPIALMVAVIKYERFVSPFVVIALFAALVVYGLIDGAIVNATQYPAEAYDLDYTQVLGQGVSTLSGTVHTDVANLVAQMRANASWLFDGAGTRVIDIVLSAMVMLAINRFSRSRRYN